MYVLSFVLVDLTLPCFKPRGEFRRLSVGIAIILVASFPNQFFVLTVARPSVSSRLSLVVRVHEETELRVDVVLVEFEGKPLLDFLDICRRREVFFLVTEVNGLHNVEIVPIYHGHLTYLWGKQRGSHALEGKNDLKLNNSLIIPPIIVESKRKGQKYEISIKNHWGKEGFYKNKSQT